MAALGSKYNSRLEHEQLFKMAEGQTIFVLASFTSLLKVIPLVSKISRTVKECYASKEVHREMEIFYVLNNMESMEKREQIKIYIIM